MAAELLLLLGLAAADAPADVDALMSRLRAIETFQADFVETKTMALFSKPLVTKGRMVYRDPGELSRKVAGPRPARVVVTDKVLLTIRGEKVERLELSARPEARALVTALLSLLRGDKSALQTSFRISYEKGEGQTWRLRLEPSSKRVGALVKHIVLEGEGDQLLRYVVREASGDEAVTAVSNVKIDGALQTPERWFGTP